MHVLTPAPLVDNYFTEKNKNKKIQKCPETKCVAAA
jgi:hypothetical protein